MTLAGMCAEVERLPAALAAARPDILLLDLTPEVNFGVLSDLRRTVADCKIVLWAHDIPMELAYQALGLGISGILRNTLPADTLWLAWSRCAAAVCGMKNRSPTACFRRAGWCSLSAKAS